MECDESSRLAAAVVERMATREKAARGAVPKKPSPRVSATAFITTLQPNFFPHKINPCQADIQAVTSIKEGAGLLVTSFGLTVPLLARLSLSCASFFPPSRLRLRVGVLCLVLLVRLWWEGREHVLRSVTACNRAEIACGFNGRALLLLPFYRSFVLAHLHFARAVVCFRRVCGL